MQTRSGKIVEEPLINMITKEVSQSDDPEVRSLEKTLPNHIMNLGFKSLKEYINFTMEHNLKIGQTTETNQNKIKLKKYNDKLYLVTHPQPKVNEEQSKSEYEKKLRDLYEEFQELSKQRKQKLIHEPCTVNARDCNHIRSLYDPQTNTYVVPKRAKIDKGRVKAVIQVKKEDQEYNELIKPKFDFLDFYMKVREQLRESMEKRLCKPPIQQLELQMWWLHGLKQLK